MDRRAFLKGLASSVAVAPLAGALPIARMAVTDFGGLSTAKKILWSAELWKAGRDQSFWSADLQWTAEELRRMRRLGPRPPIVFNRIASVPARSRNAELGEKCQDGDAAD